MGLAVVTGATAQCTFGTGCGVITATSQMTTMAEGKPLATIADFGPQCVGAFGLCTSLANPAVLAATTAALGVLTPMPCTMVPMGTWTPAQVTVQAGGNPVLTNECQGQCAYGGCISIANPGQTTVII